MTGMLTQTPVLATLAVCESPHKRLRIPRTKMQDVLQQVPRTAAYRKHIEQIINEKLSLVKMESNVKKLEDRLQDGQIQDGILLAENILILPRKCSENHGSH